LKKKNAIDPRVSIHYLGSMLGIPVGLLAANATEWVVHRLLHETGKKKGSITAFHWHEHHRNCRRHGGYDPCYHRSLFYLNAQSKEVIGLAGLALSVTWLAPLAPFFVGTVYYSGFNYYFKHKRAHLDPEWGRQHLPWHYDHHMGPNQQANWCVTKPWFDHIMGTREEYVGTEREAKNRERNESAAKAAIAADAIGETNVSSASVG
jgi:sterol desaturase/sphingolipid hydroxylase (fatty acid hydroxylase superfamily)